jgi:hypothetical protein
LIKKQYKLIDNYETYVEAVEHIRSSEFLTFDTETTGLNVRKEDSPFVGNLG